VELPGVLPLHRRMLCGTELNRHCRVMITHDLRPAKISTDKGRTGNTCSTTELPRHLEPEAGLEPATTRITGDNPILQPVEIGVTNRIRTGTNAVTGRDAALTS
jgi:hypothetical protein